MWCYLKLRVVYALLVKALCSAALSSNRETYCMYPNLGICSLIDPCTVYVNTVLVCVFYLLLLLLSFLDAEVLLHLFVTTEEPK